MTMTAKSITGLVAGALTAVLLTSHAAAQSEPAFGTEADMSANPDNCEVMTALTGSVPAECDTSSVPVKTRGISINPGGSTVTSTLGQTPPPNTTGLAAEPTGAPAPRAASFQSVQFAVNSAALAPAAEATLDTVAEVLRDPRLAEAILLVEGHTDASGSDDYNMALSERRAIAVVDYLTSRGVDPRLLTPRGMGETRLADPANPRSGVNRRVVIVNIGG